MVDPDKVADFLDDAGNKKLMEIFPDIADDMRDGARFVNAYKIAENRKASLDGKRPNDTDSLPDRWHGKRFGRSSISRMAKTLSEGCLLLQSVSTTRPPPLGAQWTTQASV